jgi:hypothetical protein
MKKKLNDQELDSILLMVRESAARLDVHDVDFFEEYESIVRESRMISPPGYNSGEISTSFITTDLLLGIGLVFLGQTAASLYEWLIHRSLDSNFTNVGDWLYSQPNILSLSEEASKVVLLVIKVPGEMDESQLQKILLPQIEALMKSSETTNNVKK